MYKQASKIGLRFNSPKGILSVEQLWGLKPNELDSMAVSLEEELVKTGKKSFMTTKSSEDKTLKLKFDIVLDVLTTKLEDAEAASTAADIRRHNARLDNLISEKEEEEPSADLPSVSLSSSKEDNESSENIDI